MTCESDVEGSEKDGLRFFTPNLLITTVAYCMTQRSISSGSSSKREIKAIIVWRHYSIVCILNTRAGAPPLIGSMSKTQLPLVPVKIFTVYSNSVCDAPCC